MTLHDLRPVHTTPTPVLVRFVAAGLLATVESALDGGLPLPRLARELTARTDTLTALGPPVRPLTRLRWLRREASQLDAALRAAGRTELDHRERAQLDATLETLRDTLTTLLTPDPLDPASTARPAQDQAAIAATTVGVATVLGDEPAAGGQPSIVTAMAGGRVAVAAAV